MGDNNEDDVEEEEDTEDYTPSETAGEESADTFHLEDNTEKEHLENFKKISDDLKAIEDVYTQCIEDIDDANYTEDEIESCLGKNFLKVVLDIHYETMKILSRGDSTVKEIMFYSCYVDANSNEIKAAACDLLEKDILDLLWNSLPF